MGIGTGVTMHVSLDELPDVPVLILRLSKHLTTVVNGIIQDTFDPSRDGNRAVYGYFTPPPPKPRVRRTS